MARENEITPNQDILAAIKSTLMAGDSAALVTLIGGSGHMGDKLLVREDLSTAGTLNDPGLQAAATAFARIFLDSRNEAKTYSANEIDPTLNDQSGTQLLFERIAPEPRLIVCGAGHVGASLARLGPALGFRTILVDDRAELLLPELFSGLKLELIKVDDWSVGVRAAIGNGRGASVAIVTRGHREDEDCLRSVLAAQPDYVGMIGSRRRTNIVLDRLRATGVGDDRLNAVRAPI
ncbi:MAG: XdhC/CoxI family protein, partial [Pyrinomonadaceae bacterium]